MKLTVLGTTSKQGSCPTLYRTERGSLVIQGTTVTDPDALAQLQHYGNGVPAHESAVEVPAELLRFVDVEALPLIELDPDRPEFVVTAELPPAVAR